MSDDKHDVDTKALEESADADPKEAEEHDMKKMMEDVSKRMGNLEKRMGALEKRMGGKESSEQAEESEQGSEVKRLSEELSTLQRQLAEERAVNAVRARLPQADEATVKALAEAKLSAPDAYSTLLALAESTAKATENAEDSTPVESGEQGAAIGRVSYDEAVRLGEAKGIKSGSPEMLEYIGKHHRHLMA